MDPNTNSNLPINNTQNSFLSSAEDKIQEQLNIVTKRLLKPNFLKDLSTSRLPSQATSETSLSSSEIPSPSRKHLGLKKGPLSPLSKAIHAEDDIEGELADIDSSITGNLDLLSGWSFVSKSKLKSTLLSKSLSNCKMDSASDKFTTFEHGHNDLVLAVDFNFYGNRMVTASSDHRLKVWDKKDETWSLVDTWRAHDAEIVDVKWNGPFTGSMIGSIGEDGQFRLWEEDTLQPPQSSRRFQRIQSLKSETKIPYCSLDFKNLHMETYVALITRDGYLSILEPVDHDNLGGEWNQMLQKYVCPTPSRQEETGFRVSWHKEKVPCWTAIEAGLDRKSLGLAVAAMNNVKIYRTDKDHQFYEAAQLAGARNVIRDVSWSNGSMRGYDVIATASKDGNVRIYELYSPDQSTFNHPQVDTPKSSTLKKSSPSGIGAGLANNSSQSNKETLSSFDKPGPGRIKHQVKKVAELSNHNGSVWRVQFSQLGDLLISTGDDGSVKTWKKSLDSKWLEYSQIDLSTHDP